MGGVEQVRIRRRLERRSGTPGVAFVAPKEIG
jgi:hypothetical protein